MHRTRLMIIAFSVMLLLFSCSGEIPNPIVGTYSMTASGTSFHSASIALKKDGTFILVQIIPDTEKTLRVEGTYEYVLRAFDFTSADGSIHLTAKNIPSEIKNAFITDGANYFLYSWKCDKNNGPESLTLTTNPNNTAEIYVFEYSGGQNALDSYRATYSNREST